MASGYDPHVALQRVLLLERTQGFQNRAAMGGLSAFARKQTQRGVGVALPQLGAVASALEGYEALDRHARETLVADALRLLLTGLPANPPPMALPAPETTIVPPEPRRGVSPPTAPIRPTGRPRLRLVHSSDDLNSPLTFIKGIGKTRAEIFARLGVETVRDLLYYFPRTHYDYTDTRSISRMRFGEKITLVGTIDAVRNNRTPRGILYTTATISDATGTVGVRWFNQPYLLDSLPVGARIAITGEPDLYNGNLTFVPRDHEVIDESELTHAARLVPVYPLTKGLYHRSLRSLLRTVLEEYVSALEDFLPSHLRHDLGLRALPDAVMGYHFPADERDLLASKRRLAFDELLLVQLGFLLRKRDWQRSAPEAAIPTDKELQDAFVTSLPFALTGAQQRVIDEILDDMGRPIPMSRLLQGDVGSGKTVVATAALLQAVKDGKQGVLMAPTEILAEQHFRTISELMQPFDVRTELLVGSMKKAQRTAVYAAAEQGEAQIVIGTHALIQDAVGFARLGLAITDEQHRFGVEQRGTLRQKGLNPHVLAMTATPIPRSLAMTIYGDLDVSSIEEMPPGRVPPITSWVHTPAEAYRVVRGEVSKGRQAFVICPVIEESAESDMRSVMAEHRELEQITFADLKVGLLHGRMKPGAKEKALDAFRNREYDILVATSVVEVGIDVPNATAMVIRDAHRFGLAQLHQFRGRVGRGGDQAYCLLLTTVEGDDVRQRLEAITINDNGFDLAEEDLRLRGPGEFWGTRQSGLPALRIAKLGDVETIGLARRAAVGLLDEDPDLSRAEHEPLRGQVRRFWAEAADLS